MRFHIETYLISILVAIAVILSPNVGICLDNIGAELESDEICCVQSRCEEVTALSQETSISNERYFQLCLKTALVTIIYNDHVLAPEFSALYCVFLE